MSASYLLIVEAPATAALARPWRADLAALGWSEALCEGGSSLWTRGAGVPRVWRDRGLWVVGEAHRRSDRGGAPRPETLNDLLSTFHGPYVAIAPARGGETQVLRSPYGALDAFVWRRDGLICLADDLEGLPRGVWPLTPRLDWDVVASFFVDPTSGWGPCALSGVDAVAPGEMVEIGGGDWSKRAAWRPGWFAAAAQDGPDPSDLIALVTASVANALAGHDRVLLEVSGGLDSAIVATSLAAAGLSDRVAVAINQFAADAESDERALAREVCTAAKVPLQCLEKPVGQIREADLTALAAGVRPAAQATDVIRDRLMAALCQSEGATVIVTGQGGDAVFFQMPSPFIVRDLMQARGLAGAWSPEAQATARWLRRSLWSMASLRGDAYGDFVDKAFHDWLGPRAKAQAPRPAHPWLADLEHLAPAKRLQVHALAAAQMKHGNSLRGRAAVVAHPLLAQPVMEYCLGIASWRLTEGRDRGFARRAFAQRLPPSIVQRRSKGALSTLYAKRVAHSLDVLRPWLLEGVLCGAEVLDRPALETALTPQALLWQGQASRLASAAVIEGWARHWERTAP